MYTVGALCRAVKWAGLAELSQIPYSLSSILIRTVPSSSPSPLNNRLGLFIKIKSESLNRPELEPEWAQIQARISPNMWYEFLTPDI